MLKYEVVIFDESILHSVGFIWNKVLLNINYV